MAMTGNRRNTALGEKMRGRALGRAVGINGARQEGGGPTVLNELGLVIVRHVKRRALGTLTLPGLLKINVVRRPRQRRVR